MWSRNFEKSCDNLIRLSLSLQLSPSLQLHLFHQQRKHNILPPEEIHTVNWSAGWRCWCRLMLWNVINPKRKLKRMTCECSGACVSHTWAGRGNLLRAEEAVVVLYLSNRYCDPGCLSSCSQQVHFHTVQTICSSLLQTENTQTKLPEFGHVEVEVIIFDLLFVWDQTRVSQTVSQTHHMSKATHELCSGIISVFHSYSEDVKLCLFYCEISEITF